MNHPTSTWILFMIAFLAGAQCFASNEVEDAAEFHTRFLKEVRVVNPNADAGQMNKLHFLPDASTSRALHADSLEEALNSLKQGKLETLSSASAARPLVGVPETELSGRKLTIVLVPGVFAEFIKNRAFEDVLEKPSSFRDEFKSRVKLAIAGGNANAKDKTLHLHDATPANVAAAEATSEGAGTAMDLDELIHVGEMNVHGAQVRVILFNTPFSSLESLGTNKSRARIFNRRLSSYLAITGEDQDLAFVGYSRGTPLGLEMLSQARAENKKWVKNVKAMISLSGVVLGSTLADDATKGENSPTRKILEGLKRTSDSLELVKEEDYYVKVRLANDAKWAAFAAEAAPLLLQMNKGSPIETLMSISRVDPRAPVGIAARMWSELGLKGMSFLGRSTYNDNIARFRFFLAALLDSVKELSSESRVAWFESHELPKNPTYYAMTAAMANPEAGAFEKDLFANPLAYGSGSYDDTMLVQNRKDYEALSKGLALNDSQVAVLQMSFPNSVLERLSPAHRGLKTKFLGTCGTHHWGMALREVNKMRGGQVNGFPREALLRALAVQVLIDSHN